MKQKKKLWIGVPVLLLLLLVCAFLIYSAVYYHADGTALAALRSDETVSVSQTSYGWFFDGPSKEDALVFYPGAKVEEIAYAPLMRLLAERGMDVCLVKMPLRFAFFGMNRANDVMEQYAYAHYYIGGHSLGGAIAANYAAENGEKLAGIILLAAYPTKQLPKHLKEITVYGSEDRILNMEKLEAGKAYAPDHSYTSVISSGNHAQFGNYGEQRGDGKAGTTAASQQEQTAAFIMSSIFGDDPRPKPSP
ncbi:MAG: alpha/beta fold hydrolase [Lachnospiraceae bacterium]|nr:alpha/beta fold hydrolase [Lachnospiraceae bacterium]